MRKLILIIGILFGVVSYGQENKSGNKNINKKGLDGEKIVYKTETLVVNYNFKSGTFEKEQLKPKHKQPIVFKIININKFAHNTEITSTDLKINDSFLYPSDLEATKIIAENKKSEDISRPLINTNIVATSDIMNESEKKISKNVDQKNTFQNEITKIDNEIDELTNKITPKKNSLKSNKELINNNDIDIAKLKLDTLKNNVLNNNKELLNLNSSKDNLVKLNNEIKDDIDDLELQIEIKKNNKKEVQNKLDVLGDIVDKFNKKANDLIKIYTEIQRKMPDINRLNSAYDCYINFILNPDLNSNHYKQFANKTCVILESDKRNEYQKYIKSFDDAYVNFTTQYSETMNNSLFYEVIRQYESYGNLVKLKLENIKAEVETINKLVNVNELRKKLNNVEILDKVLTQDSSFEIISSPIQALEDYIEFKVNITQNNDFGASIVKHKPLVFTYTEYVRQGVRWDVSVGTVFDFGIKNQQFEVKEDLPTTANSKTSYTILENNTSQYTPTIAGLLHTSFRSNSMFAFGFSLGVSIDLTSLNLNSFFPGVSLLIGKKEKTIFTIGPAFKKVNQLKSIYKDTKTSNTAIQVADITSEQFKIGWFVGISYNLTNSQKSKIKLAN